MDLYANMGKCVQILPTSSSFEPLEVYPNMIFDADTITMDINIVQNVVPFSCDSIKEQKKIVLCRTYALGDVIQLIPIARHLRKTYGMKVTIATSDRYTRTIKTLFPEFTIIPYTSRNLVESDIYGIKLGLDGVLEADHSNTNPERLIHRVHIYSKFILDEELNELDWTSHVKESGILFKKTDEVIGIQLRGSGKMKTMPEEFVKKMVFEITKTHKVMLIDQDSKRGFEGKNIINACGRTDIVKLYTHLKYLKCCLTMDSGVLWLAHMASCPTITFLSSTRKEERLSLHPLYKQGKALVVDLAKDVGCKPCFETTKYCGGSINCMNKFNYDRILNSVMEKIKLILKDN